MPHDLSFSVLDLFPFITLLPVRTGAAFFWDLSTGELVRTLDVGFPLAMCDVAWHPSAHLVSFASFGEDLPICTYSA